MQENEITEVASTEETGQGATETTANSETTPTAENQTEETAQESSGAAQNEETGDNAVQQATAPEASSVPQEPAEPEEEEEVTYHAVQKEDNVTAIWEMQGRKHIRTIDPRSREGAEILRLFTAEEGEEAA